MDGDIAKYLAPAQRTPGWNNRSDQPAAIRLAGGCMLHVVPAWLWRPRPRQRLVHEASAVVRIASNERTYA